MQPKLYLVDSRSTPTEPDIRVQAAGAKIQELIKTGLVTGLAFIITMRASPGSDNTPYTADIVGDISTHRLLASGICDELKDLLKR